MQASPWNSIIQSPCTSSGLIYCVCGIDYPEFPLINFTEVVTCRKFPFGLANFVRIALMSKVSMLMKFDEIKSHTSVNLMCP